MIEEKRVVFIAAADYTDECRVDVRMRRKHMDLSAAQAREFAAELVDAAELAELAAASTVRPVALAAFELIDLNHAGLSPQMQEQVEKIATEHGATVVKAERLSPDCRAGKHPASWLDEAWDDDADVAVPCECPCHTAPKGTAA